MATLNSLTVVKQRIQEAVHAFLPIMQAIHKHGGTTFLVGGAIRDAFLDLPIKDCDVEVHDLTVTQLEDILKAFGTVSLVGKSFGVLKVHGINVDWSLPRVDSIGRKPMVYIDEHMPIEHALKRRDLTMNAMAYNVITEQLIDPFGGVQALQAKKLRAPDISLFVEDPLRFFRVMHFISRFEMMPDEELEFICRTMNLQDISRERIEGEFEKMLLKSKKPSLGLRWLNQINRLDEIFPELGALCDVPQNPQWHPEGDVFEHTMQTLDAAVRFSSEDTRDTLMILYAALCHDLGKATTTLTKEGKIISYGHERESVRYGKDLLHRITRSRDIIDRVVKLVQYHMSPGLFVKHNASQSAYKRLASKLSPECTLYDLARLSKADKQGRNGTSHDPLSCEVEEVNTFIERSQKAQVLQHAEAPLLLGRDLMPEISAGPALGKVLRHAYHLQINQMISDKDELKRKILDLYYAGFFERHPI